MAKLLSGTRIYGNAAVDTFITVGGTIYAGNIVVDSITANTWYRLYTANINESLTNLFYTNSRVVSAVVPLLTTANVIETSGNLYFTVARVNATVQPFLTTANVIETSGNLYFTNARVIAALSESTISGNLTVTKTVFANSFTSLSGGDPTLTSSGSITLSPAVGSNVVITSPLIASNVLVNILTANNIIVNGNQLFSGDQGANLTVTRITANIWNGLYTANVIESPSNLYFTVARVNATVQPFLTTANVIEISSNLYFTAARANAAIYPSLTTANVVETDNLYYTNSRVISAVNPLLTTSNVVEGTNLYFTPQRVIGALLGNNVTVNNLTVSGDLEVQGNVVNVNTATLNVEDKNIVIANGAINSGQADGAGITIAGANANITYQSTGDKFVINKPLDVTGNINGTNAAFLNGDPVITLNPLNQSIAVLRSQLDAPVGNVLYVSGNGNDRNSGYSLANALANIHTALNLAQPWTTVFVKSGDYVLYNQPVTIKNRVGMVGDNLRTTTIRPSELTKDMFYVNNACYVTGFTFRNHLAPAAVFSYNPDGSAGFITTSPYIQNSSSITTTGTGMRVNGAYVSGLRSMVVDSYTQTNEGGIGMHMLNRGYTQLVSVFTICCDIAILAEDGGFCSITNSNASFGRLGLLARGVSNPLNFGKFDRVEETDAGTKYVFKSLNTRPNYGDAILFANYNKAKCERDTGLIVDSLAFDLAYQSNTQSAFAGLQYWSQSTSAIPNQATETIAAFNYAKNLSTNVALNVTITSPRQANVTQTSGTAGAWVTRISDGFDLVANIITGGTVGITDRVIPNGFPANTNVAVNNAANLVLSNKEFIQKEVIAFVNQEYPGFFANANNFISPANAITKCERDTGYLIDSIVFDFLHNGNRQAITSGVYYYNNDFTSTQIANQIPQTTAAYDYIGTLIDEIVRNITITSSYQTVIQQNTTAAAAASLAEANLVLNSIDLITNIITVGANAAPTKSPISYSTLSTTPNVINAAKIILANRNYIVAEVSQYVDQNWSNISNGSVAFYTVANATPLTAGNVSYVTLLETFTDETILANASTSFHQPSYISALGYTFEYIGSGTVLAQALPYAGGVPIQANEVTEEKGGRVYFTSTDQQGDFRIGDNLVFNRVDGTISGRTFTKALFATMTPYILAIEG